MLGKKKMVVLHFRNCRGIETLTGPETYLIDLFNSIDKSEFEMKLACVVKPKKEQPVFIRELEKHNIAVDTMDIRRKLDFRDAFQVGNLVRRYNVDILHCHDSRSDFLGLLLRGFIKKPMIVFAHGWVNWDQKISKDYLFANLERYAVNRADKVIIASKAMGKDLVSGGCLENKIVHIPYGIDIDKFRPNPEGLSIRQELGISPQTSLVGMVSRFHPWKGHKYFLDSAKIILGKKSDTKFLIVGDICFDEHKKYREEIYQLVEKLGLSDKVIFTGTRVDIEKVYNALDIFVLPSLREPFGIVVLEAQACQVPVVATDVGGVSEVFLNNKSGLLVSPGDSNALAEAVIHLLNNKEMARKMGAAGREWVKSVYSKDAMAKKTQNLYIDMCQKKDGKNHK